MARKKSPKELREKARLLLKQAEELERRQREKACQEILEALKRDDVTIEELKNILKEMGV